MTAVATFLTTGKSVVQRFVLPALARASLFAAALGCLLFVAGVVTYNAGTGLPFDHGSLLLRGVVLILTVGVYTFLGVALGFVIGGASSISRKLSAAEDGVHQLIAPITDAIIERLPTSGRGLSIEEFTRLVDARVNDLANERKRSSGAFSFVGGLSSVVLNNVLPIVRRLLVVNFVKDLQEKGETHVMASSIERFTREKMVRLAVNFIQVKLYAVRKIAVAVLVLSLVLPVILLGFRLAS